MAKYHQKGHILSYKPICNLNIQQNTACLLSFSLLPWQK